MKRLVLRALCAVPVALLLVFVFLWSRADWDLGYLVRVLWRGESGTSDHRWKRSAPVAASGNQVPWREVDDCGAVAAAFDGDLDTYLRRGGALALVVVRDGAIVCEWYGNGGARERSAMVFSISKTVTSLLLARAVAEGRIGGLDETLATHVPALVARDRRFGAITLAQLVDMRSGIAFDDDTTFPWVDEDAPAVYYASDLARTVVRRPAIAATPGTFRYNDFAPNLVGLALERAYGGRLAPGPMQSLWSDLGAAYPAAWLIDDEGFAWHESGLVVTARDLARVGQLVLDGGRVGARQVAPAAFVTRSLDPAGRATVARFAGTELGYRNGWWVAGDDLLAMGRHGQLMVVSPSTRTVIVRLGLDGHGETNIAIAGRLRRLAARLGG